MVKHKTNYLFCNLEHLPVLHSSVYNFQMIKSKVTAAIETFGFMLKKPRESFNVLRQMPFITNGARFGQKLTAGQDRRDGLRFDVYDRHLTRFINRRVHIVVI